MHLLLLFKFIFWYGYPIVNFSVDSLYLPIIQSNISILLFIFVLVSLIFYYLFNIIFLTIITVLIFGLYSIYSEILISSILQSIFINPINVYHYLIIYVSLLSILIRLLYSNNLICCSYVMPVSLVLGSYWSSQHIIWGSFWSFDPVELLSLLILFFMLALVHFHVAYYNFIRWQCVFWAISLFLVKLNSIESIHIKSINSFFGDELAVVTVFTFYLVLMFFPYRSSTGLVPVLVSFLFLLSLVFFIDKTFFICLYFILFYRFVWFFSFIVLGSHLIIFSTLIIYLYWFFSLNSVKFSILIDNWDFWSVLYSYDYFYSTNSVFNSSLILGIINSSLVITKVV